MIQYLTLAAGLEEGCCWAYNKRKQMVTYFTVNKCKFYNIVDEVYEWQCTFKKKHNLQ